MSIIVNGQQRSVELGISAPELPSGGSWDSAKLCEHKGTWEGSVSVDVDSIRLWENTNGLDSEEKRVQWSKDLMYGTYKPLFHGFRFVYLTLIIIF